MDAAAGTLCMGCQTDYRESVAQTDPWEPPSRHPEAVSSKQAWQSALHCCTGPEVGFFFLFFLSIFLPWFSWRWFFLLIPFQSPSTFSPL